MLAHTMASTVPASRSGEPPTSWHTTVAIPLALEQKARGRATSGHARPSASRERRPVACSSSEHRGLGQPRCSQQAPNWERDARGPVASPRPRHHVAPAPTSVDGNLPPTLGPAPNQRPDPGAEPVPPPPRHPSTWLAHARPCRALRPASSPGATGETRGLEVETGRPGLEIRTQYKIHCAGSLVPRRECARTVRSSSKASNPTFQPLIGSQEPPRIGVVPVINLYSVFHRGRIRPRVRYFF